VASLITPGNQATLPQVVQSYTTGCAFKSTVRLEPAAVQTFHHCITGLCIPARIGF